MAGASAAATWSGQEFTAIASAAGVTLAGSRDGIYRSVDGGSTWLEANAGLTERHIRWLAFNDVNPSFAYAGAEPAAIFTSRDAGESWTECGDVTLLRDRYRWELPYSPAAGCIRGFAFRGSTGYAAAEVGGVLRSGDWGVTWDLVRGSLPTSHDGAPPDSAVHDDVHSVEIGPLGAEHVFAATGGGLYVSTDGGVRWTRLYRTYCRAVWVDTATQSHLVLGPADSVDRGGRIERSMDGGEDWEPYMTGLDQSLDTGGAWPRTMVERFMAHSGRLFAVLSDGRLLVTGTTATGSVAAWRDAVPEPADIRAVAAWEHDGPAPNPPSGD